MSSRQTEEDELKKIDIVHVFYDMWKGLKRFWRIMVLIIAACAAGMFLRARVTYHPVYQAYNTFTVTSSSAYGYTSDTYNSTVAANLGQVFPYILKSEILRDIVAKDLGTSGIPGSIHTQVMDDTNLITLTAEASDGKTAYRILQSYIRNYPKVSRHVLGTVKLESMDASGVPASPSNPESFRTEAEKGVLLGLVIVFFVLLIYALARKTVTDEDDLRQIFHAPILGKMPEVEFKKRGRHNTLGDIRVLVSNEEIPYAFRESVRRIRTRFNREADSNHLQMVLVTSSVIGEGKSTVASNLALSLAREGKKVLLIDGDLRNPSVEYTLGLTEEDSQRPGFCELLTDQTSLDEVLQKTENDHLFIIPGGRPVDDVVGILSAEHTADILQKLRTQYDRIIIDAPPSALLPDAAILADYADGILYVVRQDYCRIDRIISGVNMFADKQISISGCILNGTESGSTGYGHGYGYGYGSGRYGEYGYGGKERKK